MSLLHHSLDTRDRYEDPCPNTASFVLPATASTCRDIQERRHLETRYKMLKRIMTGSRNLSVQSSEMFCGSLQ